MTEIITYLVQNNNKGKIKFIQFTLNGDTITREWGLIGGKTQISTNTYETINMGKSNELSPIKAALAEYDRIWNKKIKEGYIPAHSLTKLPELPTHTSKINLDHIPTEFCLSKPTKEISRIPLAKLLNSGNHRMFVKYNGGAHFIVIGSTGIIKIFTRRWNDHTLKYPKIVKAVAAKKYLPNTLLAVELCIDPLLNIPHMTCQKYAAKISKINTNKGILKDDLTESHALQKLPNYSIKVAVYGILYYSDVKLWDQQYDVMLKLIEKIIPKLSDGSILFQPQNVGLMSNQYIYKTLKDNKKLIEGFIIWDITKAMEVTMNGKPVRRAAWKLKIKSEKDVIAYDWENAKNKPYGVIGALKIGQYDSNGNMVDLGTVGGLKPTEGETEPSYWNFPCVIEVGYDNLFPETGKFQFGHFNKKHEDKAIEEVEIFNLNNL